MILRSLKTFIKLFFAAAISIGLFFLVYGKEVPGQIKSIMLEASLLWTALMIGMLIPILSLAAFRWHRIVRHEYRQPFLYDLNLYLSSKAFSVILPLKLGDFSRSYFLKKDKVADIDRTVALTIFERILDILALCVFLILGVLVSRDLKPVQIILTLTTVATIAVITIAAFAGYNGKFFYKKSRVPFIDGIFKALRTAMTLPKRVSIRLFQEVMIYSILLWTLHIGQFSILFNIFKTSISIQDAVSFIPFIFIAGMLPFTIGGVGSRDAALVYFFSDTVSLPVLASVGIVAFLRILLPTIVGVVAIVFFRSHPKLQKEIKG
ncbi:MAG: lysylphosphatidylglycerol synthase transmembrane domain-containing protein [Pseudomonadota bacterium]